MFRFGRRFLNFMARKLVPSTLSASRLLLGSEGRDGGDEGEGHGLLILIELSRNSRDSRELSNYFRRLTENVCLGRH